MELANDIEVAREGTDARGAFTAALLVAIIALLAAAAFAIGHTRPQPRPAALATPARGSVLTLRAPATWAPARAGRVPGLRLRGGVALAAGTPGAGIIAGLTRATGPTLLPSDLRRRVAGRLPDPEQVQLGRVEALRYRAVRVTGLRAPLTLFAVPATNGVVAVACFAPAGAPAAFASTCERVAATIHLRRGRPLPVTADARTARRISRVLATLDRDRRTAERRLRTAPTGAAQAAAASTLAAAYANAAIGLVGLRSGPAITPTVNRMAERARATARSFRALYEHAAAGDAAAYAVTARRVRRVHETLRRRTAALAAAGYRVG